MLALSNNWKREREVGQEKLCKGTMAQRGPISRKSGWDVRKNGYRWE
jgi:hypothetical protein